MTDENSFFSIRRRGKGIPYGGIDKVGSDEDANMVFDAEASSLIRAR